MGFERPGDSLILGVRLVEGRRVDRLDGAGVGFMEECVCGAGHRTLDRLGEFSNRSVQLTAVLPKKDANASFRVNFDYDEGMPRPPKPGGAVIEPRSFTDNPKKFGMTSSRLTPGPVMSPQQGAAEMQHALSNKVREHLLDIGMDLRAFCASTEMPTGLSYERLYRSGNGTTMLGLTDIVFWSAHIPGFVNLLADTLREVSAEEDDFVSDTLREVSAEEDDFI